MPIANSALMYTVMIVLRTTHRHRQDKQRDYRNDDAEDNQPPRIVRACRIIVTIIGPCRARAIVSGGSHG